MGLFKKKEPQVPPEPVKKPEANVRTEWQSVWTNLTDKMLRVELEGDKATAGYTYVKAKDDRIQLVSRGVIFAEIGKRGKAYKELEPHIGSGAEEMEIEARDGDYGAYYRVGLKFKSTVIEYP